MDSRFHSALLRADVHAVARLIEQGVDVNALSPNGCSALSLAAFAETGSEDMVRLIINAPSFVGYRKLDTSLRRGPNRTLLHTACQGWSIGIVRILLVETDAMQSLNEKDGHGWTPLHCAATRHNGQDVLSLLIQRGARLEPKNALGYTALGVACDWQRFQNADVLIEAGADCSSVFRSKDVQDADFLHFICQHRAVIKRRILIMCGIWRKRMGICRDLVNLLAHYVWATRFSKEWDDSRGTATIKK